jgi:hypothetical protein
VFSFVSAQGDGRPNFRQRRVVAVTADSRHAKIAPDVLRRIMRVIEAASAPFKSESAHQSFAGRISAQARPV